MSYVPKLPTLPIAEFWGFCCVENTINGVDFTLSMAGLCPERRDAHSMICQDLCWGGYEQNVDVPLIKLPRGSDFPGAESQREIAAD